jgi:filamentous hemagglutinin family protein
MVENRSNSCWVGGMFAVAIFGGAIANSENNYVLAQVVPDNTLGTEASIVPPQGSDPTVETISGGATRGNNLFHSFDQFSVLTGRSAYFNNATNIQNIISRVTGGSISNIDGLLRANGTANLFLLNPNGIIFGANARLDIGGSFIASTATRLNFADGTTFSATAAQTTPLLTVNVPIGLQYGTNAGSIVNQSRAIASDGQASGLQVKPSTTLALIGGDVRLDGGIVRSPASRVELGGLAGEGTVGLNFNNSELRLSFPNDTPRADVSLNNTARVDVTAGGGGSIAVTARNLNLAGRSTLANGIRAGQGVEGSQAGDVMLDTTGAMTISQSSSVLNTFDGRATGGQAGNIDIKAGSLTIDSLGRVSTRQERARGTGQGKSGNISVQTNGSVTLFATDTGNNSAFSTLSFGGSAGNVSIQANDSISISDSEILASSFKGAAGAISLQANNSISITNNSFIASNVFEGRGDGGNITIKAGGPISITDISWIATQSGFGREQPQQGSGGNIYIEGKSFSVLGGSQLSTRTFSFGNAGNIDIKTSDFVEVSGRLSFDRFETGGIRLASRQYSTLLTSTEAGAIGTGGEIRIATGTLRLFDGGTISAQSSSAFRGGKIVVNAEVLDLNRGGQILTTASNSGDAGDIIINAKDRSAIASSNPDYFTFFNQASQLKDFSGSVGPISPMSGIFGNTTEQSTGRGGSLQVRTKEFVVRDKGQISVSSQSGNAGNIAVAAESMRLEDASLTATTRSGNGGNITLQIADSLLLRRNSSISAAAGTAQTGGDGGNINIDTKLLVALENSELAANAFAGRGGNIQIGVQGLFISPDSRISATSDRGIDGVVTIDYIDVDPSQGLVALPIELVDASNRIAAGCAVGGENQFVVTGRGGLPPTPRELINTETVLTNWAMLEPGAERSNTIPDRVSVAERSYRASNTPQPIVEATAWQLNEKNEVVLMAASTQKRRSPALNCNGTYPSAEILLK